MDVNHEENKKLFNLNIVNNLHSYYKGNIQPLPWSSDKIYQSLQCFIFNSFPVCRRFSNFTVPFVMQY